MEIMRQKSLTEELNVSKTVLKLWFAYGKHTLQGNFGGFSVKNC